MGYFLPGWALSIQPKEGCIKGDISTTFIFPRMKNFHCMREESKLTLDTIYHIFPQMLKFYCSTIIIGTSLDNCYLYVSTCVVLTHVDAVRSLNSIASGIFSNLVLASFFIIEWLQQSRNYQVYQQRMGQLWKMVVCRSRTHYHGNLWIFVIF